MYGLGLALLKNISWQLFSDKQIEKPLEENLLKLHIGKMSSSGDQDAKNPKPDGAKYPVPTSEFGDPGEDEAGEADQPYMNGADHDYQGDYFQDKKIFPKKNQIRLPTFAGDSEPGAYKEWWREIKAMKKAYMVDEDIFGSMVFFALKKDAWDVVWEIDPEMLDEKSEFDKMKKLLDAEYDTMDYEKADLAHQEFEKCRRSPGMSMKRYLLEMDKSYKKMIKEDPGTKLSDQTLARRLLRRSGLATHEKRQIIAASGHAYSLEDVKQALRLTFGDCQKDDRSRPFYQKNEGKGRQKGEERPGKGKGKGKKGSMKTYFQIDELGSDQSASQDDLDDRHELESEEGAQNDTLEHDEQEEQDQELDPDYLLQVYYQGMKAGKRLKSLARGWNKDGEAPNKKKPLRTGKCLDCGEHAH